MLYLIAKGNIFKIEGVINYGHGCNCAGAMDAGIAVQFKNRYPKMYEEYKRRCSEDEFLLGDMYAYKSAEGETIFNLATQDHWTSKAEMMALDESMRRMMEYASTHKLMEVAIPAIAAGLGGGNWTEIKEIMQSVADDYPEVDLYVVEEFADMTCTPN